MKHKPCEIRAVRQSNENFLRNWRRSFQFFTAWNESVPLRRSLEANFDDLLRIGDVVPSAVGLPTFGNNLNESATERSFRDVGDASTIGFDIEFEFFVPLDEMLFDVLDVDAGVFDGNGFFASGDFDGQPSGFRSLRGNFRRSRGRILRGYSESNGENESKQKST